MKIPFISQTYTKAVAISFRQSHTKTVGSKNLQLQHAIIADPSGTMEVTLWPGRTLLAALSRVTRTPSVISKYIRRRRAMKSA